MWFLLKKTQDIIQKFPATQIPVSMRNLGRPATEAVFV
jgi:hypothetical protein